ncbi:MAG: tetratricopeptide repeat protein [Planctomycetia bacterium]|nr:tetratricopeptide repeat protein [Planctomycetia bacterium]
MSVRVLLVSLLVFSGLCQVFADDSADDEARKTAERFLMVLERNPRKGTALDRVLEFHAEHGSLDELAQRLREKAVAADETKPEEVGRTWMVVGVIDDSRGETESAVEAFGKAEKFSPSNALASFALGQSLITLNRLPDAAAALERAIERKPAPTELLDVFQTLGRVQQRLQPGDKVIEVWSRLEKLVPNDPRVPELIARTLLDDGHLAAALPRYEAAAKAAKDLYRRSELELEVIDIRLKLGQTEQALSESDRLLGGLKPDHWLFRETRRRIEQAFLANEDTAGLVKHYEGRLTKHPDDTDAIIRLSRALIGQERLEDARKKLESAIQQSPKSAELRLELIELFGKQQQFAEAVAQYEQLDRITPNNPDYIRDWGFAVLNVVQASSLPLKDKPTTPATPTTAADAAEREGVASRMLALRKAASIWRKLVEAKPKDAVVAAQVAGLMRQAGLLDDSAELLRRAVVLAPETLPHREELGEVLDALKKKDESLAVWRSMAEEPRRTATNLGHLAEVLGRFGYRDESLKTIDAACEFDRKSLELLFQQIALRRQWKQFGAAREAIGAAAELADSPETFDRVVQREIDVLSEAELLTTVIEELREDLGREDSSDTSSTRKRGVEANDSPKGQRATESNDPSLARRASVVVAHTPAAQWFRLARLLEASAQLREATIAAQKSAELAPKTGIFLQTAARMLAQDNQWQPAIDLQHKLIAVDRRFRVDALRSITELEVKLGRKERALKSARDLLAAAPGAPEPADFVSDVYLRFGLKAEALHVLRRASRQNPADKRLALKLTEQLVIANHIDEARESLWRVFEQSAKLDDRTEVTRKLSELAALPGEFDKLIKRLERLRQDPKLSRDATLCLVQVHEQAGDAGQARRELERLLPQEPRDLDLLKRMTALCEASGDIDAAIVHQRRIVELATAQSRSGSESQAGSLNHEERLIALLRRAGRVQESEALAIRWLESERDPAKILRELDRLLTSMGGRNEKQSVNLVLALSQMALDRDPQQWEFMVRKAIALGELGQSGEQRAILSELMKLPLDDDTPSILTKSASPKLSAVARIQRIRERFTNTGFPVIDYGQARRLAIDGHLMLGVQTFLTKSRFGTLTEKRIGPDEQNGNVIRGAWDDVYARWNGLPNVKLVEACLKLQSLTPDDAATQWLALEALISLRDESAEHFFGLVPMSPGESLDNAAITHLQVLLRSMMQQGSLNWDSSTLMAEQVARELIRANRMEELDRLLRDIEESVPNPSAIAWLLKYAAKRHATDEVARLLGRYVAAFDSTKVSTAGMKTANPGYVASWVQYLMLRVTPLSQQAEDGEQSQQRVLKILDEAWGPLSQARLSADSDSFVTYLCYALKGVASRPQNRLPLSAAQLGSIANSGQGWFVWQDAEHGLPKTVEFPTFVKMPECAAIRVLMQAHSIAAQGKWTDKLREHWQAKIQKAEPQSREQYVALLGMACLFVWEGSNDAALPVMGEVFDLAGHLPALQFDIAWFHQRHGSKEVALELLSRIESSDGNLIKEIELRALDLAAKLKNTERAKEAAEKLFGVKLEPAEELALAKQLSELGLKEQSQALLVRAPQRHANDVGVLLQVMLQHENQKNLDEACAVAEQIIRRTQSISTARTLSAAQAATATQQQMRVGAASEDARKKAFGLLASAGKLAAMIEQSEQQFESAPNSLRLFTQLMEQYSAAVATEKQKSLLAKVATSEAPDPLFRLQIARSLVAAGNAKSSVPHYLFVLEKSPNATSQVLFEAESVIKELGNAEDLARIVLRSKVAANDFQRVEMFARLVNQLEGPPIRGKLIIELFQKAWRESPDFRPQLAQRLLAVSPSVWQQEEMWELAREVVLPAADRQAVANWSGVDVLRLDNGRNIEGLMPRLLDLAQGQKKLDELARDTEAALTKHPGWLGGRALLGMVRMRQGNTKQAREELTTLLKEIPPPLPVLLSLSMGYEVARHKDLVDVAMKFYEPATSTAMSWEMRQVVLEHCRVHGKIPEFQQMAIDVLLALLPSDEINAASNQSISSTLSEVSTIAKELNQPYIAARIAQSLRARAQQPNATNDNLKWFKQYEERFAQSCAAIKPEMLPTIFRLAAHEQIARGSSRPRLDLLLHVSGESVAEMQLHSPLLACLKEAATDDKLWPDVVVELDKLKQQFPDDFSIAITAALAELSSPKPPSELKLIRALAETAAKPNQSSDLLLGLWIIARECTAVGHVSNVSEKEHIENVLHKEFAKLSLAAAQQQRDPRFLWSMLREQGQFAFKRNDREAALSAWTTLTNEALRPRPASDWVPMLFHDTVILGGDWPDVRWQRSRDLASMTLDAGYADLSLKTFRDTVAEWAKPEETLKLFSRDNGVSGEVTFVAKSRAELLSSFSPTVFAAWQELEPRWREKQVPAESIFATLSESVFPADRPDEVAMFALPVERDTIVIPPLGGQARLPETGQDRLKAELQTKSLGLRLVQIAVAESRVDELRKRLDSREKTKESEMSLRLLWLQLALATRDETLFAEQFAALEGQSEWSWSAYDERVVTQIIRLLSLQAGPRDRTAKLFARLLSSLPNNTAKAEFPAADLRRWLARCFLEQSEQDQGRDIIAAHLRHMEGVWSAAGAMDGQHLRRMELLNVAREYAAAGMAKESLELLGQAADARWPDKFAEENPGEVLSVLREKTKTLSATDRFMLWRTWTLPDSGSSDSRTQLRLMVGASRVNDQRPQLISSAHLLIESAREANRLDELATFVATEGPKRFDGRVNVLLAMIRISQADTPAAESLLKKLSGDSTESKPGSALRTQTWDNALLSAECTANSKLSEIGQVFSTRAAAAAKELKDATLLELLKSKTD